MDKPHVYFRLMLTALRQDPAFVLCLSDTDTARLLADAIEFISPDGDDAADTANSLAVALSEIANACGAELSPSATGWPEREPAPKGWDVAETSVEDDAPTCQTN